MQKITDEQQLKINKLMHLKYKWHKKIMVWTWFFIVLYSIIVFLLLININNIEYFFRSDLVLIICLLLCILLFFGFFFSGNINLFGAGLIKLLAIIVSFIVLLSISFLDFFLNDFFISIGNAFFLFVIFLGVYLFLSFLTKNPVKKNTFLVIYFIFYSVFLFPVLLGVVSDVPILGKIGNLVFGLSPFLLFIFRYSLVDIIGSGFFIRKLFFKKDLLVWTCPVCNEYILKKPVRFCPHCGNDKYDGQILGHYCTCGFIKKIGDFDFPSFCPHCGLSFGKRKRRKNINL